MPSSRRSGLWSERVAHAEAENVRYFLSQDEGQNALDGSAISYRHDWGDLDTSANLFLEWESISASSRVFVSITEGSVDGFGNGMRSTKCSLFEVASKDGGIGIKVNVEGTRPIRLFANYLVINA